ncbi:MAG: hypothetical protein JSS89_10820 [Bacteroidetes bacterium]|nr:hypothetical protein [Bacteroidota bacterium]
MLDLLIYHLHIVGALYAFTKRWQEEGLKGGFLALGICALAFTILWSLTGPVARMIMPQAAVPGDWFTSDTLSLILVLIPGSIFFWLFFYKGSDRSVEERDEVE